VRKLPVDPRVGSSPTHLPKTCVASVGAVKGQGSGSGNGDHVVLRMGSPQATASH
jgi:hypothetical protein